MMCSDMGGGDTFESWWNPADSTGVTFSNSNKTIVSPGGNPAGVRGGVSHATGKYYFEIVIGGSALTNVFVCIRTSGSSLSSTPGIDSLGAGYGNGVMTANGGNIGATCTAFAIGDVVGCAVDVGSHKICWSLNGTWQNSANPSTGAGATDYITTSPVFPSYWPASVGSSGTLRTKSSEFTLGIPSGYSPWV